MDNYINKITQGDCLELMKDLPDNSIDMILCDLPYNITQNKWDSIIDMGLLWKRYDRIIKDTTNVVLFGCGMFTASLMLSNRCYWKYNLVWDKLTFC